MCKFFKTVFIVGLCGVGAVAAAHVVLGKERTQSAAIAIRQMAQSEVDELIRKQGNLRAEMQELRSQYPEQIALLKSQQAEVLRRQEVLTREETRANSVIRLCEEDICHLEDQQDLLGLIYDGEAVVEHRGSRYTPAEAEVLIGRVSETRQLYVERLGEIRREQELLGYEYEQLGLELMALESERDEFELEYQTLLREMERIERNEQRLKYLEQRRGVGVEGHSQAMQSLSELRGAVDRVRLEQEERMRTARARRGSLEYEARARELENRNARESKRITRGAAESQNPQGKEDNSETEDENDETT
jgi:hypothetical protein